jgi:hypothetical protein
MVIHEWIDEHKVHVVNIVRARRGCDELADELQAVLNVSYRVLNEAASLRGRIRELEAELAKFKPEPPPVEREEYGQHIKWTGD